jgi:hypothetical protein
MRNNRIWMVAGLILTLALAVALGVLAKPMYPLPRGTSADFWCGATGAQIKGMDDSPISVCFDGDFAYYTPASMDSTWTYWLPKEEAMRDFPEVVKQLEVKAGDPANVDAAAAGYRRWRALPMVEQNAERLMMNFEDEKLRGLLARPDVGPGVAWFITDYYRIMTTQIERSHLYWANAVFEFLWLGGLIWFSLWPFIHGKSLFRKTFHAALIPFLLLLPAWLGYCAVLGGGVGPAGGILYPWFTIFARCDHPSWDLAFYEHMPHLLDHINQGAAWPVAEALRSSGTSALAAGPVGALVVSVFLVLAILGIRALSILVNRPARRRQGFEVVMSPNASEAGPKDAGV